MGSLNRCHQTDKIKTAIHLIRTVRSLSFPGFPLRSLVFLCSAQNGNNEYVRVQIRKIIQAANTHVGSLLSTLRIKSVNTK